MESLLRWSIENSAPDAPRPPSEELKKIDPGIIDMILGKPDSVLMKEALATGLDENASEEDRVAALDDFEMLVEQIDNAKNLTPLQMYPQIISLLDPKHPDKVRMQALWILGTAVQNNPEAQRDFLKYDPIPLILSILSPSTDSTQKNPPSKETRSKAAYALSGTLKHSAEAVNRLNEVGGWDVLKAALQDSDITVRRKVIFLINALLMPVAPGTVRFTPLSITASPPGPSQPASEGRSSSTAVTAVPEPASGTTSSEGPEIHRPQHIAVPPVSTTVPAFKALQQYQILPILVESLVSPLPHGPDADEQPDPDYTEKAARTLLTYLEVGGVLTQQEKEQLRKVVTDDKTKAFWGLDDEAWKILQESTKVD